MAAGKARKPNKAQDQKPANVWDPLPRLRDGNKTTEEIYVEVGRALAAWEHLEIFLAAAFVVLIKGRGDGARRAYGYVQSFRGRQELISGAIESLDDQELEAVLRLKAILAEVRQFNARRNEIAHGLTVEKWETDKDGSRKNVQFWWVPAIYNSPKMLPLGAFQKKLFAVGDWEAAWNLQYKFLYTAEQIAYYRSHFDRLCHQGLIPLIPDLQKMLPD